MTTHLIVSDRIYIPENKVDHEKVEKIFLRSVYNDDKCEHCEFRPDRHCEQCDQCPNYIGTFKLHNEKEINGKQYIGIPVGARNKIPKITLDKKFKVTDKRVSPKMKHDIKFIGTERDYQVKARKEMVKKGYGVLKSMARTGKTVMFTAVTCKLKKKTLIMASQQDWLDNFYETFYGNEEKGIEPMTNAPDIEKFEGKKIIGFCKRYEDFVKYDVCFATYQTFLSPKGKRLLKKIRSMFGVIGIDEVHDASATEMSKIVNAFKAKHRFGLTATDDRKDGKYFITESIIGPVQHTCKVKTLKPTVTFIESGFTPKKEYKLMHYALRALETDEARTKLIVKHVIQDVKAGHSVVIPVAFTSQMQTLVDAINKKYGKTIAAGFHGKLRKDARKKLIADARSGKIKVVIGIRKIIQVGLNVPRWSCLYEISPISNPPRFLQETSRILTPMEGKLQPVIRFFLDNLGFSRGCLRTCMYKDGMIAMGFKFSVRDMELARKYTSKRKITPGGNGKVGGGITSF